MTAPPPKPGALARTIAAKVRELRKARLMSQADLAARIGLSQNRLSEIERGGGSFTAEQFLTILQTFNVSAHDFVPSVSSEAALQNALARLGAVHLHESERVLPSERLHEVTRALRETLVQAQSPRLLTALAPVLVQNASQLALPRLRAELSEAGLQRRLGWLLDNTLHAIRAQLASAPTAGWSRRLRRAEVVLETFLDSLLADELDTEHRRGVDILDAGILSKATRDKVSAAASDISKRWGIVTSIQPEDFAQALEAAREGS